MICNRYHKIESEPDKKACRVCLDKQLEIFRRNRDKRLVQMSEYGKIRKPRICFYRKDRYSRNPEPFKIRSRKYYSSHMESCRRRMSLYQKKNLELFRMYNQRRHALKMGAPGFCSKEQFFARIDYYGGKCWMCGKSYESIDHVIPLSKGGSNWPSNLRPACLSCNSSKGNRSWKFTHQSMAEEHI